jgi:hypothetical protein
VLAHALPLADAASEGLDVIQAMLVVGLIFVGVIALGQLWEWSSHRRRAKKARRPSY